MAQAAQAAILFVTPMAADVAAPHSQENTTMLRNFFAREDLGRDAAGQALVEYGLLVGLIAVVCIAAITLLGTQINNLFTGITTKL